MGFVMPRKIEKKVNRVTLDQKAVVAEKALEPDPWERKKKKIQ